MIRNRIELLNAMQPESLFIRCGMYQISARRYDELGGVRFQLWFRPRSCDPEVVSLHVIADDYLSSGVSEDVFQRLARWTLVQMERSIESCWES